jgi:hypothetical protein
MNFMSGINIATTRAIENVSLPFAIDGIDSSPAIALLYKKKPLDHLILNGFHACSQYFEAGNDHFALFGLEFE